MSSETEQVDLGNLSTLLIQLADEVDGIVDFGVTMCLIEESQMAGRHTHLVRQRENVRRTVASLLTLFSRTKMPQNNRVTKFQAELASSSELFLKAFTSLESFRSHNEVSTRTSIDALRTGWEAMHQIIRDIAESAQFSDPSWFDPILERQGAYRANLNKLESCFHEASG